MNWIQNILLSIVVFLDGCLYLNADSGIAPFPGKGRRTMMIVQDSIERRLFGYENFIFIVLLAIFIFELWRLRKSREKMTISILILSFLGLCLTLIGGIHSD